MPVSTFLLGASDVRLYSMADATPKAVRNIDLSQVMEWANYDPIWKNRGLAIQGFAQLELGLQTLLTALTEMSWESSATIFYKITNISARNSILEKLLHQKHGAKFNAFWNPYVKELHKIDLKRNEIVHWLAAANVLLNDDNILLIGVTLVPPASVIGQTSQSKIHITSKDLLEFANKCDDFSRLAVSFASRIKPPASAPGLGAPWLDIFQLPLVYPLPEHHPYRRPIEEPEIQPQSFPPSLQFLRLAQDGSGLQPWNS